MVETTDQWITERTGIKERRIADFKEAASDLAYEAAKAALEKGGIRAETIDLIIVGTISGDMPFPSTACFVQKNLGALNAAAFDVSAACSGFIYGLYVADGLIKAAMNKRVLVIGSELLTRMTDWTDRSTCVLFGDGAGAVVLEPTEEDRGILSVNIESDGRMWELIHVPGGGSREPASDTSVSDRLHFIRMKGNETFKVAVRTLEDIALRTLEENDLHPSQLSLLIPHQANLRIIQATAERLGVPMDKVFVNLERCGNTSAASVPIALDEAVMCGRISDGDYILLEAFGGGLTWASALIKW
jgi:3-oxoacyl-[acyl-carrier-protein] synthase III